MSATEAPIGPPRSKSGGRLKPAAPLGPRTRQRRAEYAGRMAVLHALRGGVVEALPHIIGVVRSQTELNGRDRARRARGGRGAAEPLTYEQRQERYERQNAGRPLTVAQQRQLRRLG